MFLGFRRVSYGEGLSNTGDKNDFPAKTTINSTLGVRDFVGTYQS